MFCSAPAPQGDTQTRFLRDQSKKKPRYSIETDCGRQLTIKRFVLIRGGAGFFWPSMIESSRFIAKKTPVCTRRLWRFRCRLARPWSVVARYFGRQNYSAVSRVGRAPAERPFSFLCLTVLTEQSCGNSPRLAWRDNQMPALPASCPLA